MPLGLADAIAARSVVERLRTGLPGEVSTYSLRPRLYDHFAIVHRRNAVLSRPIRAVVEQQPSP